METMWRSSSWTWHEGPRCSDAASADDATRSTLEPRPGRGKAVPTPSYALAATSLAELETGAKTHTRACRARLPHIPTEEPGQAIARSATSDVALCSFRTGDLQEWS